MNNFNPIDLFEDKAQQHEKCATIATVPDVIRFHDELAVHYRRLAGEIRDLLPYRIPWSGSGSGSGSGAALEAEPDRLCIPADNTMRSA